VVARLRHHTAAGTRTLDRSLALLIKAIAGVRETRQPAKDAK